MQITYRKHPTYNTPDITAYAKRVTNRANVVFSLSCRNWRVVTSTLSAKDLLAIGLTKKEIEMLSIRTLTGRLDLYRNYCRHGLMWSPSYLKPLPCYVMALLLYILIINLIYNKWDTFLKNKIDIYIYIYIFINNALLLVIEYYK